MTTVYFFRGKYGHGEKSRALIRKCAERFCAANGIFRTSFEIKTAEGGKPFFADGPGDDHIEFSVSNSGEYWVCAVSTEPCGIDVQVRTGSDWKAVARRWFKPEEQAYVGREGEDGFYRVWVRREAYGKMTGEGFFGKIPALADQNGRLKGDVTSPETGSAALLTDVGIPGDPEGVYCSLCSLCSRSLTGEARTAEVVERRRESNV